MTEWSVETCSLIISSNKCCADVNNWLIEYKNNTIILHLFDHYINDSDSKDCRTNIQ